MKIFKKLALSILGVTVLSLGLYACSNDNNLEENNLNEQVNTHAKKQLLYCITTSCCSVSIFSIQIFSVKECTYIDVKDGEKKAKLTLISNEPLKEVTLNEDFLLSESNEEEGWYIPKGTYSVVDNVLTAKVKPIKVKFICFSRTFEGDVLGHEFKFELKVCSIIPIITTSKSSVVTTIDLNLTKDQLEKIQENGNYIEFNEDLDLKEYGIDYTLKAGKHFVNEDGKIYISGVFIK